MEQTSLAPSADREDDFAALKQEALRRLKEKRRRRAVVLPSKVGHAAAARVHVVQHCGSVPLPRGDRALGGVSCRSRAVRGRPSHYVPPTVFPSNPACREG